MHPTLFCITFKTMTSGTVEGSQPKQIKDKLVFLFSFLHHSRNSYLPLVIFDKDAQNNDMTASVNEEFVPNRGTGPQHLELLWFSSIRVP